MEKVLSSDILILAYKTGYFPMAEHDGAIYWHNPDPRCIIPLSGVKPPSRSFKQTLKKENFTYKINHDFESVIKWCANRDETWISEEIITSYVELNKLGFAHSVETYSDGTLAGGLYGVAIGGAFFGESMFSLVSSASKAAFYHLVSILNKQEFVLLDSQYITDYTKNFGAIEIPREKYLRMLNIAITLPCTFQE